MADPLMASAAILHAILYPVAPAAVPPAPAPGIDPVALTNFLRVTPMILQTTSYGDTVIICNALGIPNVVPAVANANQLPTMRAGIYQHLGVQDPTQPPLGAAAALAGVNPKWSGGTEQVTDLITSLGPIITLIAIIYYGTSVGNTTSLVNIAIAAITVWSLMFAVYWLAKGDGAAAFKYAFNDQSQAKEIQVRTVLLGLTGLLGVVFVLLTATITFVGYKIGTAIQNGTSGNGTVV